MPSRRPHRSSSITRRDFVRGAAALAGAAGAGVLGFPAILRGKDLNDKLNIAVIGCGGRGASNLGDVSGENIVALCDVNENNLNSAARRLPRAQKFRDFRKLYDTLKDGDFDAVVVSTTEHTHAFATLPALRRKEP